VRLTRSSAGSTGNDLESTYTAWEALRGWTTGAGRGTGVALAAAAEAAIEEAVMDAATMASTARRRTGSVTHLEPFSRLRLPLRAARAYRSVLASNHADTAMPSRRTREVSARSGLTERNHCPR
jgi:hypothetical protein